VTNRTNYALRAVLYLSLQEAGRVVPISEVAHETGLSVKFLEEILLLLRTAGIVQSRRGKQGGYMLVRPPHEMTVADVVTSLEGDHPSGGGDGGETDRSPYECVTEATFRKAADAWWSYLNTIRLSELAGEVRRQIQERAGSDMFHI
jgi:Rrf2 family protein